MRASPVALGRVLPAPGLRSIPLALALTGLVAAAAPAAEHLDVRVFFAAASSDESEAKAALRELAQGWREGYAALLIDLARFFPPPRHAAVAGGESPATLDGEREGGTPRFGGGFPDPMAAGPDDPRARVRERLVRFLDKRTGQSFGHDLRRWRRWMWSRPYEAHPDYAFFKATLYGQVDRRMAQFFPPGVRSLVRLDEVDWGGVGVNGIPPLDHPRHVAAAQARYLQDGHVVFGIALNGEARAYPKRILAWHELVRDRLGGVELAVVYCTLCGTVIPYRAEAGGAPRTFGTSGLLYRSNKLMFDEESLSLWSTLEGRPVIGPLAGSGLELQPLGVVTTTWREWREEHPDTTVLALETGHQRDYSEGAAYRDYFATDRLMFEVPKTDSRLKNKDEVLALLLRPAGEAGAERLPLALSARFLRKNPVHSLTFAGRELVVVTSREGANRVYETGGARLVRRLDDSRVADEAGRAWRPTEEALVPDGHEAAPRPRVPAWRAFWFGWSAQFPHTELVK
jgi:hypothetical protein